MSNYSGDQKGFYFSSLAHKLHLLSALWGIAAMLECFFIVFTNIDLVLFHGSLVIYFVATLIGLGTFAAMYLFISMAIFFLRYDKQSPRVL